MNKFLRVALSELKDNYHQQEKKFENLQVQSHEEQTTLTIEINALEQRLRELKKKQSYYEEEISTLAKNQNKETLQLVMNALENSVLSITSTAQYLEQRKKIESAYQTLLQAQPDLEEQYKDYMKMEASRDVLPASYLKFHEETHRQLAVYLKLKKMDQDREYEEKIYIQVAVAVDEEAEVAYWMLPCPVDEQLPIENKEAIGDSVIESLANVVIHLATDTDWYLSDIILDLEWFKYPAVSTPYEYKGDDLLERSAERIFRENLSTESIFQGCQLDVDVAQVDIGIWRQGEKGQPDEEPDATEVQLIESETGDSVPLAERSLGFYSEEDIVSWERPLRTSDDSMWNVQGRRLRTLLVNLISKGHVGQSRFQKNKLYEPLPPPHRDQMQEGLKQLIGNEILIEISGNGSARSMVSINPIRLDDIQDLVNRDITEMWMTIVQ